MFLYSKSTTQYKARITIIAFIVYSSRGRFGDAVRGFILPDTAVKSIS